MRIHYMFIVSVDIPLASAILLPLKPNDSLIEIACSDRFCTLRTDHCDEQYCYFLSKAACPSRYQTIFSNGMPLCLRRTRLVGVCSHSRIVDNVDGIPLHYIFLQGTSLL